MVPKLYFPQNLRERLSDFEVSEHNRIKTRYESIHNKNFDNDLEGIEARYTRDVIDSRIHCKLLSCCLSPFLRKEIKNFELLFIEPLLYLRNNGEIERDIPIWDFILGEIVENEIVRLIFGEVKGQKAGAKDNLALLIQKYQELELLEILSDYIRRDSKIIMDINKIEFEFILVVQNLYLEGFIDSIKERKLKFNIWELRRDWIKTEFQIHIHRHEKILKQELSSTEENRNYRKMLNSISSKKYSIKEDFVFTYASDLNRILDRFKKLYENKYGLEMTDDKLISLINDIGGGKFYDDEKVVEDLLVKLKSKYLQLDLVIKKKGKNYFRERIDPKERVIAERLKHFIENKKGELYFNQAIEELKPKKSQKKTGKTMDEWLK